MSFPLSRRQFVGASVVAVVGAAGYGVTRAVRKVREAARRMSDE